MGMECLYILIPCFNEEEVIRETAKRLLEKFEELEDRIAIMSMAQKIRHGKSLKDCIKKTR